MPSALTSAGCVSRMGKEPLGRKQTQRVKEQNLGSYLTAKSFEHIDSV